MSGHKSAQDEYDEVKRFINNMGQRLASVRSVPSKAALKHVQASLLKQLDWFFTPNGFTGATGDYSLRELLKLIKTVENELNIIKL